MLPNVRVNVTEEVSLNSNGLNSFLPLVILKTKTGPIGTETLIRSPKAFVKTFGTPDADTPEAFGLYNYIKNFGSAYVLRVAGSTAAKGTCEIKAGNIKLVGIETVDKTDYFNGIEVNLIYDGNSNKLYLTSTVEGKLVASARESINYSEAGADDLEVALNKVVNSFNDAQTAFVATNAFTNKTSEDDKPDAFETITGTIGSGISGNAGVTDSIVTEAIERFRHSDIGIDAILTPGFESTDVVTKLANVANDSSFIALASVTGSTATAIEAVAMYYPASSSLILYADNVYLNEDPTIAVPACIAVMPAYINRDLSSKWLAPAGVTRATLTDVNSLVNELDDENLEELYTADRPVNGIKRISGRGYVVWGQKTTSQDTTQYQDRANVVRLCKYLEKEIYRISYDYLFEPITEYTYNSWTLSVESILEEIKRGNGLSEYKVVMDDTLNTEETKKENKLIGQVKFKPLEAAEFIEINFVVTDTIDVSTSEGGY